MELLGSVISDVSRLLRRSFDARARKIGVTRPQWQVLTTLARNEGVNQGRLAELLDVEPITVCRMVDRLQDSDLVERRADPADRRSWRLFLTEQARGLLSELRPLAEERKGEGLDFDCLMLTFSPKGEGIKASLLTTFRIPSPAV